MGDDKEDVRYFILTYVRYSGYQRYLPACKIVVEFLCADVTSQSTSQQVNESTRCNELLYSRKDGVESIHGKGGIMIRTKGGDAGYSC